MVFKSFNIIFLICIMVILPVTGYSQEGPQLHDLQDKELQLLRAQLEATKKTLVDINSELVVLQELAQFPARSQIAVFVGMDKLPHFQLESVELRLDGVVVTLHRYTAHEKEAMRKGGLHRLYTGNVADGAHTVKALFKGQLSDTQAYSDSASYNFRKADQPTVFTLGIYDFLHDNTPEMTIREDR